ncbi:MAG: 50S ribosomal protein L25 [Chloracidobacterium sp.]|uniref:Large ribosomal subunit protein bL25 n=1 Tax=Chloracidobacterium validum TaxID=2821543 RepID=A0ABX8B4X7_9BACT|nr:50S ribosomal protein L25 [Chloracidobacterium validum]QUW02034.1 50S ribosomal protein L25 [Chloracidobacterium validum]
MIAETVIEVQPRQKLGSNEARRNRRAGSIPVNVYGRKQPSFNGLVDRKAFAAFVRTGISRATVFNINLPEEGLVPVIIREVQTHPVRGSIEHLDFFRVALDEPVKTPVPLRLQGEPLGVRQGAVLQRGVRTLTIKCLTSRLPKEIVVDIADLKIGGRIYARDIPLPDGAQLLSPATQLVASLVGTRASAEATAAAASEAPKKGKK